MSAETPAFSAGARLGVYEISGLLGAGDTGEVYRAWDTYREREVALKILPHDLTRDSGSMIRFRRAVEILVTLAHPSIASLYGFEELQGERVLTMELTEGRLLSDKLAAGALPTDEAVAIITRVAAGLEHAHRHRLVHGHLHPADVKIEKSGGVKVYDFGLTRAIETLEAESGLGEKATVERPAIWRGKRVATYQSPEQLQGKLDERTDIWALGVILWEMLTGTNPFERSTISETSHAVLTEEPDWSTLPDNLPPHVRRGLQLCLQKRPPMRFRNAGDVVVEITIPFGETETPH